MTRAQHWDDAYEAGDAQKSWYQATASRSMRAITSGRDNSDAVIDVGGGASTLVDGLLSAGYGDVTVLDVSPAALALAQERLGPESAARVQWIVTDLLSWRPSRGYDVWHDRAVLHFLTDEADRAAYREVMRRATGPGSRVVISGFALDGPQRCSGLPVHRSDAAGLMATLGDGFVQQDAFTEDHVTPTGAVQQFQWLVAERER